MSRPTFITLGPSGTCHENALLHYLEFQGIEDFDVLLEQDLLAGVGRVRGRTDILRTWPPRAGSRVLL